MAQLSESTVHMLGEAHRLKPPTWPGTKVTICMSCFTTGGPGKEHGANKSPPTGRVQKVKRRHHMSEHRPESFSLASILAEEGVYHLKDFEPS